MNGISTISDVLSTQQLWGYLTMNDLTRMRDELLGDRGEVAFQKRVNIVVSRYRHDRRESRQALDMCRTGQRSKGKGK